MGTASRSAAIYCRISKDKEGAGLGVQRQEQDCRELAQKLGWTVTHVFTDNDISAYSGKRRPHYEAMLQQIRSGVIKGVLAWHTDRLHRSPLELESYIDASELHGAATHTVKAGEIDLSTPSGRAVARTLGAWARYESEHKSERITRKKLQLAQSGAFSGGPVPFGYRMIDGKPTINDDEATEIRGAYKAIRAGMSIGFIVRDLNGRGIQTRRGQKWTSTAVRNLLIRPTYAGLSVYKGDVIGASVFPAIITDDEWRVVDGIIRHPSRLAQNGNRVKHLLAGLAFCGTCGEPLKTSSRRRNGGQAYYYKCKTTGGGHVFQNAAPFEHLVQGAVLRILSNPDLRIRERLAGESKTDTQGEAAILRARLDEAAESFASGTINAKQLGIITERINGNLEALNNQMVEERSTNVLAGRTGTRESVEAMWASASLEERRSIIDALVTVHVDPAGKAAPRKFDASRVRITMK